MSLKEEVPLRRALERNFKTKFALCIVKRKKKFTSWINYLKNEYDCHHVQNMNSLNDYKLTPQAASSIVIFWPLWTGCWMCWSQFGDAEKFCSWIERLIGIQCFLSADKMTSKEYLFCHAQECHHFLLELDRMNVGLPHYERTCFRL